MSLPILTTKRLILKPLGLQHAADYQRHFNDYEVIKFLSSAVPWPYPVDGAEFFIKNLILPRLGKDRWAWGLFLKSSPDELIGCVDLWRNPIPENRGFWLGRKFWGQGLMTEAVAPITKYAFESLGFERLYFSNAVGNPASRRVKEKSGAKFVSTRPAQFVSPEFKEAELWVLEKEAWEKQTDP